jgi:WD40 repeat protein
MTCTHYLIDRKYLAACGSDNNVNVWNLGCKNKPLIFKGHTDEVLSL